MAERGHNPVGQYDIVIVGGGMVGATLAWTLQAASYRCALVENVDIRKSTPPGYDERSIVLSYGSSRILEWLDLWSRLALHAEPIYGIHVSERGRFGVTRIHAQEERVPALGYVIPARSLGELLVPKLLEHPEALQLYAPAQLLGLRQLDNTLELELRHEDNPMMLRTRLLVAADGADSTVRRLLNINAATVDYRQDAVITNISTQCPHNNTAYERFTESGPLALLPLQPFGEERNRCAVVWTLHAGQAEELLALDEQSFLNRLQQRFGNRLGRLLRCGSRAGYPLTLVNSELKVGARTVLIGNAAQTLHPVAGQGFNLALRDASILLQCLLDSSPEGDPGSSNLLADYRGRRARDQQRVIMFTDGLVRLFSNDLRPLAIARSLGLITMDLLPGLRRRLVRQGMGLNMPLPRIGHYRQ
ncbi:MAG TPA: 2-octaprenyl-6-methoxyphenyl hydroxylase [Gammaproteobacteria bacterium]|nr:2-octaprenyl-6-methoxyphenyl hydroxylase [Gammaproteobacteria bacterium]